MPAPSPRYAYKGYSLPLKGWSRRLGVPARTLRMRLRAGLPYIGSNVTKIGSKAFYNCTKLKKIVIGTKSLTSSKIGSNAFKSVYSKVQVKVPSGKKKTYTKLLSKKGLPKKAVVK